MDKYTSLESIASGSFGDVFLAEYKSNHTKYAIKKIKHSIREGNGLECNAIREAMMLKFCKHPNIIKPVEACFHEEILHIVLPYFEKSLSDFVGKIDDLKLDVKPLIFQILSAISYIHSHGIIHRDLKPNNILVSGNLIQLIDFGNAIVRCSNELCTARRCYSTESFSSFFRPTEVLLGDTNYSFSADMWCVGVILFELLTGTPLLVKKTETEQVSQLFALFGKPTEASWQGVTNLPKYVSSVPQVPAYGILQRFPPSVDDELKQLVMNLLVLNPNRRWTAFQCLESSYFVSIPSSIPEVYPTEKTNNFCSFLLLPEATGANISLTSNDSQWILAWMQEVCDAEKLHGSQFSTELWDHLAAFKSDTWNMTLSDAQLYAITCIWMFAKIAQDSTFCSYRASHISCDFSAKQIWECELKILSLLACIS